jgi:hypothetical protein
MTAGSAPPLPDGRMVAAWWPVLARRQPDALWYANFLLHHVEAPVTVVHSRALDVLELALLRALETCGSQAPLADLARSLHLPPALLSGIAHGLASEQVIAIDADTLHLTSAAAQALASATVQTVREERRVFHFLAAPPSSPPRFLGLQGATCTPIIADVPWSFDPAHLAACIARPDDWKRRHGFPQTINGLLNREEAPHQRRRDDADLWRTVIFDRPERLSVALIKTAGKLQGFQLQEDNWHVLSTEPVFTVDDDWSEFFTEAVDEAGAGRLHRIARIEFPQ